MSGTITMTLRQKRALENKAKAGWRFYFIQEEENMRLANWLNRTKEENRRMKTQIERGEDVNVEFLKKRFIEMYAEVGKLTDCPVCFETLVKENMDVGSCGHGICKDCKEQICNIGNKECPICKKKYYMRLNESDESE